MSEQLFHIGIKALVRNDKAEVLLVSRKSKADHKIYWDIPGGRMDPGETFEQTLQRELLEEIGVRFIGTPKHLATTLANFTVPVEDDRVGLVLVAYETLLPAGHTIVLGDQELEYIWASPLDAAKHLEYKYAPEFTELVAAL